MVGSGTKVKSKAFITQSVIGKNCTIGMKNLTCCVGNVVYFVKYIIDMSQS